jgi:hypothetical protein
MFIVNKYYKWYTQIVDRAKLRPTTVGYYERHHIIPKSLGGTNKLDNLVNLTAREHFICHWLLTKCVLIKVEKMQYALWVMIHSENEHQERYKINSKKYEILKKHLSLVFSRQHIGKPKSEEHKRKISETRKRKIAEGSLVVNENKEKYKIISEKRKGTKLSSETKQKISESRKGQKLTIEQREHLSKLNTGVVWSEEKKNKLRETMKKQYASGERTPPRGPRIKRK